MLDLQVEDLPLADSIPREVGFAEVLTQTNRSVEMILVCLELTVDQSHLKEIGRGMVPDVGWYQTIQFLNINSAFFSWPHACFRRLRSIALATA